MIRPNPGLEMVGLSFLGPFLAPSVFPEEDPGVAEKYFSEKIVPSELKTASKDLQQDLGTSVIGLIYLNISDSE
jgi:hypothetical protein